MADGSKSALPIPGDSESTPLIAKYTSNKVPEQSELDVRQHESSTGDKGNYGSVAAGDIDRAGSSGNDYDRKELTGDSEVNEAEIALGEVPHKCSQQPIMMERLLPNRLQDAGDLASAAAYTSREAAISCRRVLSATQEAISKAKARVDKATRASERVAEYSESSRYRALARRYDAAIKLATTRVGQIKVAAESAENAATVAETAACKVVEEPNEDFNAIYRLSAADNAANDANTAAIVAYKTEYLAVKAMKRCWEDIDHRNVVSGRFPTRHPDEARCGGNPNGKKIAWIVATISLILGILVLAGLVPHTKNPEHQKSLISFGSFLVGLPVCALIAEIVVCIKKKIKKCKREENDKVMACIDNRLDELDNYFRNHNITPVHSDDEQ